MGAEAEIETTVTVKSTVADVSNLVHRAMEEVVRQCLTSNSKCRQEVVIVWPEKLFASGKIALCVKLSDALKNRGYRKIRVGMGDKGVVAEFEW